MGSITWNALESGAFVFHANVFLTSRHRLGPARRFVEYSWPPSRAAEFIKVSSLTADK